MSQSTPRRTWYHTIELPDGTMTPGYYDTRDARAHVEWPSGVEGGRCVDVGTFDGFWAFEMERLGAAEVVALDVDDPEALDWTYDERTHGPEEVRFWGAERGPGFLEAARLVNSRARRVNRSVYDLDPAVDGQFDVVFCGALLLHLRDPVLALERMRGVCSGWLVLVEALDPTLDVIARRVPSARFNPARDQWWRVNSAGLQRLTEVAGFSIEWVGPRFLTRFGAGAPPEAKSPWLASVAARRAPARNGMLHQALRARPRPPRH